MNTDDAQVKPATPAQSEPQVHSSAWLAAVEEHIGDMKYRESEWRRQSDEARAKAETICHERTKLESVLYKAGLRS